MPEKETSPQLSVLEIVDMLTSEPEALGLTSPARMRRDFLPSFSRFEKARAKFERVGSLSGEY